MIPLSFGDIALLNHLLEERGTRVPGAVEGLLHRLPGASRGMLLYPGAPAGSPGAGGEVLPGKGPCRGVLPGQTVFFGKGAGRPR